MAWVKVGLIFGVLVAIIVGLTSFGNSRYEAGIEHQRAEQAKSVAKQTDDFTANLVKAQNEALAKLQSELDLARSNLVAAESRESTLQTTIADLQNVKETDCTSINVESFRLFNSAACTYNHKYGLGGSGANGCSNSRPESPGARALSVPGGTGGAITQH